MHVTAGAFPSVHPGPLVVLWPPALGLGEDCKTLLVVCVSGSRVRVDGGGERGNGAPGPEARQLTHAWGPGLRARLPSGCVLDTEPLDFPGGLEVGLRRRRTPGPA